MTCAVSALLSSDPGIVVNSFWVTVSGDSKSVKPLKPVSESIVFAPRVSCATSVSRTGLPGVTSVLALGAKPGNGYRGGEDVRHHDAAEGARLAG